VQCMCSLCIWYAYVNAGPMSTLQLTDKHTQDLAKELDLGDEDWGDDF